MSFGRAQSGGSSRRRSGRLARPLEGRLWSVVRLGLCWALVPAGPALLQEGSALRAQGDLEDIELETEDEAGDLADEALVLVMGLNNCAFDELHYFVRQHGGRISSASVPSAFTTVLTLRLETALRAHPAVAHVIRRAVSPTLLAELENDPKWAPRNGRQAAGAARRWNRRLGVPDPTEAGMQERPPVIDQREGRRGFQLRPPPPPPGPPLAPGPPPPPPPGATPPERLAYVTSCGQEGDVLVAIEREDEHEDRFRSHEDATQLARRLGGRILRTYPPEAFVMRIDPRALTDLRRHPGVASITTGL